MNKKVENQTFALRNKKEREVPSHSGLAYMISSYKHIQFSSGKKIRNYSSNKNKGYINKNYACNNKLIGDCHNCYEQEEFIKWIHNKYNPIRIIKM